MGPAHPRPQHQPGLGHQRWPRIEEERPLLLVPLGSTEQHGPHLPVATDAVVAHAVAGQAATVLLGEGRAVRVAPTLPYGASGEHQDFAGTLSIGQEALHHVLVELARSACPWAEGVVFVNGHGGNLAPLVRAVRQLRQEGRAVAWTSCDHVPVPADGRSPRGSEDRPDAHAGRTETSLLRHLAPWSVRMDLAEPGVTRPVADLMPELVARGVRAVSPNGVLGDPTTSSPEHGRLLFTRLVDALVGEVRRLDVREDGRLARVGAAPRRSEVTSP